MTIFVHDYLLVRRGAERTFLSMCELDPAADVATLLYDPEVVSGELDNRRVRTTRIQRLGLRQGTFKALMPVLPLAAERLPVSGHELVISSSSAFAHGVKVDPGATHVCYCHTPFRYAWYAREEGVTQVPYLLRPLVRAALDRIQSWDYSVAQRQTLYIANSEITQKRIRRYWNRDAPVIHPPVEVERFSEKEPEDYFLVVGELVRHKQVEVALEAAERARVPIKIVGGGSDGPRLRARYGKGAEFLGRVSDDELAMIYAKARALVMPNVEEFGITAVEAQAAGRPVVAADGGGAVETLAVNETGVLFPPGDVDALARAMLDPSLESMGGRPAIDNAARFSKGAFKRRLADYVASTGSLVGLDGRSELDG